jgi:cobalt/nickel transport system ATP-binding protein
VAALLEIRNLHFAYTAAEPLLQGLNLQITAGDRLGIIGDNGCGKTTLLLLCAGVLSPQQGSIHCCGHPVVAGQFQPQLGVVLQNPADQLIGATVAEDVAFGPQNLGVPPAAVHRQVAEALAATQTTHLAQRVPHQLSGGEKRMVAIAGILAMRPHVILYDEPTAFLDRRSCQALTAFLQQNETPGMIISHDVPFLQSVCTQIMALEAGQLRPLAL